MIFPDLPMDKKMLQSLRSLYDGYDLPAPCLDLPVNFVAMFKLQSLDYGKRDRPFHRRRVRPYEEDFGFHITVASFTQTGFACVDDHL